MDIFFAIKKMTNRLKTGFFSALILGVLLMLVPRSGFSNVLGNDSFESSIGSGTEGNWDGSNGTVRAASATVTGLGFTAPPDGNAALRVTQGTFTFQLYDEIKEGDVVTLSALVESDVAPGGGNGGRMAIEFKKKFPNNTDITLQQVTSTLFTTGNANAGAGYQRFTIRATAPTNTSRVAFVLSREGANAGNVIFDSINAEVNPVDILAVTASRNEVKPGEAVTVFARFQNVSGGAFTGAEFKASIPDGFDVLPQSVRLNGAQVPWREGSVIIPIGDLGIGDTVDASFQLLVTSAAVIGEQYAIDVIISNDGQLNDAGRGRVRLLVVSDPVFDQGTLIGKVFNDTNQNGVQDEGEQGVPWVKIVTEEGIVITTDEFGRYHVPGIKPGRHIVKVDGHSLPDGTRFITEESFLIRTTPGILNKANFAVLLPPSAIPEKFQEDLTVMVTQGLDTSIPDFDVSMEPFLLKAGLGQLEKDPVFHFRINYPDLVKNWYLEIRDELGREVWTGFGVSSPPSEVAWSGLTEEGFLVEPGLYSYRFKVVDHEGHEDWTPLHFFRVISKADGVEQENLDIEIPPIGDFNLFKDGKRSIPLVAKPTLRVQGKTRPGYSVEINGRPVEVDARTGRFTAESYTTPGEKEIVVTALSPEGEKTTHRQRVEVKDSMFFMAALAEDEFGFNQINGNVNAAVAGDQFRDGFYSDGRVSYYLKGKIRGKFLVRSHFDSEENRSSALFTNFDPDEYYPVYGDASERDYEANGSRQRFYIVVEMDKAFLKWGSFKTAFTDTELASYNRTLSGLKAHFETLGSTPYGDPVRGFTAFWTESDHVGDHNEFLATGGTLYYLRNRNAIEGSEKVRVEVRDKIQDIPIDSYDLVEGIDYELDYSEGRLILTRPLSSVAASDMIISDDLLDGNKVYLIVDYEFEATRDLYKNANRGLRAYTHLGNHIRVGGTAIEEKRQNVDYDLRAVDATVKMGRNTKVTAEYAESKFQQVNNAVSHNGGLTFAETPPIRGQDEREEAWLIKGESKPVKNLELSAYIQNVEPGFSTERSRSQEGYKKFGLATRYKVNDHFYVRYRYDSSQVVSQLRPLENLGLSAPYEQVRTQNAQAVYDDGKILAQAEYLHRTKDLPSGGNRIPTLLSEFDTDHAVAAKVGYRLNDRLMPYAKVQTALSGDDNHQFGGGVRYEVADNLFAYLEQMLGNFGDSTFFGFERHHDADGRSYASVRMFDRGIGGRSLATTIGNSFSLTPKSRLFSERQHSSYSGVDGYADILGYEGKIGERWMFEVRFERRHLEGAQTGLLDSLAAAGLAASNTNNAVSATVGYTDGNKLKVRSHLEFRRDNDVPKMRQWVTRNTVDYKLNDDVSLFGKFDWGTSRFTSDNDTPAGFTEFSTGMAYRPVSHDKLNVLSRYTYVDDIANDFQFSTGLFTGLESDESAHIFAIDLAYDLHRFLGLVEKFAYKKGIYKTAVTDDIVIDSLLLIHRFNFHVTRKWDLAMEYRALWQNEAADSLRHGALVEIDREFYDYVRLGLGYNFTNFDDDLRTTNDFDSHGPFVRLTGKF